MLLSYFISLINRVIIVGKQVKQIRYKLNYLQLKCITWFRYLKL